jgi:hypothetical protein
MVKRHTEEQIIAVLKESEAENTKLKQMVADLSLDNRAPKDVLSKKF